MVDEAIEGLLQTIEEQAEIIEKQADRINRLSAILLQQCEVTLEELDMIKRTEEQKNGQNQDENNQGSSAAARAVEPGIVNGRHVTDRAGQRYADDIHK